MKWKSLLEETVGRKCKFNGKSNFPQETTPLTLTRGWFFSPKEKTSGESYILFGGVWELGGDSICDIFLFWSKEAFRFCYFERTH